MANDLEYEKNNMVFDDQYSENGIKCRNFEVCEAILPKWWYDCKGKWLCTNCIIFNFGILEFKNNEECPVCLLHNHCVMWPQCKHYICIQCYRRCFYGDESMDGMPQFPYNKEIEEKFENDPNGEWQKEFPLIKNFLKTQDKWMNKKQEQYDSEENLRVCPLCRRGP